MHREGSPGHSSMWGGLRFHKYCRMLRLTMENVGKVLVQQTLLEVYVTAYRLFQGKKGKKSIRISLFAKSLCKVLRFYRFYCWDYAAETWCWSQFVCVCMPLWIWWEGWLAGWSAGLKDAISSPAFHCSGLMSNVTLWPLSPDQLLKSLLSAHWLQSKLKGEYI